MTERSIRFAGLGGQGIIFAGVVLARAFALYERWDGRELYANQTQSYGPEARGGASRSDVVVSDDKVFFPLVERPDYLILMSQPAYDRYIEEIDEDTVIFLDSDSVEGKPSNEHYEIPATSKSEEIGARIVANVIMLGAFVEISAMIGKDSISRSLMDVVPEGTKEVNRKALNLGFALGKNVLEST